MTTVYTLLVIQGIVGAFDTIYYHEFLGRLPAKTPTTAPELKLHALRDFLYALLFITLPWIAWHGWFTAILGVVLLSEIAITLTDFVVEFTVRKPWGDVWPGERVTHAILGIIYGAMLANFWPFLMEWWARDTALAMTSETGNLWSRWVLTIMGFGSFFSGLRDLYAAYQLPGGSWPWPIEPRPSYTVSGLK